MYIITVYVTLSDKKSICTYKYTYKVELFNVILVGIHGSFNKESMQ